jgi:hypothetical protein
MTPAVDPGHAQVCVGLLQIGLRDGNIFFAAAFQGFVIFLLRGLKCSL